MAEKWSFGEFKNKNDVKQKCNIYCSEVGTAGKFVLAVLTVLHATSSNCFYRAPWQVKVFVYKSSLTRPFGMQEPVDSIS